MDDLSSAQFTSEFLSAVLAHWRCPVDLAGSQQATRSVFAENLPLSRQSLAWTDRSPTIPALEDPSERNANREAVTALISAASENADQVAGFFNIVVEDLKGNGCVEPADVPDYFRQSWETLARLYHAAAVNSPSPTRLKRLALQYVLDPRRPVDGDVHRFEVQPRNGIYEVSERRSLLESALAIPKPKRTIRNPDAITILGYIYRNPPQIWELKEFIERQFGGVPQGNNLPRETSDTPGEKQSRLTIDVAACTARLDDTVYWIGYEEAVFLKALQDEEGRWISSTRFQENEVLPGSRLDRVCKRLPPQLNEFVDAAPGKGFRLLVEKLA